MAFNKPGITVVNQNRTLLLLLSSTLIFSVACSGSSTRKDELESREALKREIEFGRLLSYKILKKYPLLKDDKSTKYVNKVGKAVAMFSGRSDISYHFAILDTPVANAYAAPGGYIFITTGALKSMKNEAELAGVLAHEIAHVNLKHIINELPPPRSTKGWVDRLSAVLSAQGTTVSTAMNQAAEKAANLLFKDGLKKQDEFEADRTALTYTAETGYNPEGLPEFLGILKEIKGEKDAAAYNTHPSLQERITQLRGVIQNEKFNTQRPILAERFKKNLGHLK